MKVNSDLPWQDNLRKRLHDAATQSRLPQSLLMSGATGLGKALLARDLAEMLLCKTRAHAQLFEAGTHPDFFSIVPEGKSNTIKVDAIRQVILAVQQTPQVADCQVVVILEADRMNTAASNALLKSLEEPTGTTYFILVSAYPTRLLATIRSRCQQFVLASPSKHVVLDWLKQQTDVNGSTIDLALMLAYGAPLKAKALTESDMLNDFRDFLNATQQLLNRQSSLQHFLKATSNIEPDTQIMFWHAFLSASLYSTDKNDVINSLPTALKIDWLNAIQATQSAWQKISGLNKTLGYQAVLLSFLSALSLQSRA